MENNLIGRREEQKIFNETLTSNESEMVALIGRRRVGKTFLVKKTYQDKILFEITGLQSVALENQLQHFNFSLYRQTKEEIFMQPTESWLTTFQRLVLYLDTQTLDEKRVIFFDEVPWMATKKSDFIVGLGFFWNNWAVNQNVVVVICGSAASWMIENVVNDTGGLHNRITKKIFLNPFNLHQTEAYFKSRNINLKRHQIVEIYMALGGVPHYLKEVKSGKSAVQNIEDICFAKNALLRDEFSNLYPALFSNSEKHIDIIRALATSRQGLTRTKLLEISGLSEGGNTTKTLNELEQSDFTTVYYPFGKKKKGKLYRLTDYYSLFYLQFMEDKLNEGPDLWKHLSQTQAYKIWCGYAYENICLQHLPQIKKALGISGIYAKSSTFLKSGKDGIKGTQIDLLLDRNDKVVNIFEIKFYNAKMTISADYAEKLREKLRIFQETTKTKKYLMLTLITSFGLHENKHSLGLIEQVLTLDDLFSE